MCLIMEKCGETLPTLTTLVEGVVRVLDKVPDPDPNLV
jgi:hypothetical protein